MSAPLIPGTYDYGKCFEHFVILECFKRINYFHPDYRLSYLRSPDGLEVDCIIERPGRPLLMLEIKSATRVHADQLRRLKQIAKELKAEVECVCFAQVTQALKFDDIFVYPWVNTVVGGFFVRVSYRV